ncbi:MAG: hypothetical protein IKM97_04370 [Clostridia bacterium]|nr:hypothetical protein [Clostridia bacterium]
MAMNPMQRRARNSFLTGMLVTLVVMAIVVVLLLSKINQLNEDKEKLIALQKKYFVAAEDISSGDEITQDSIIEKVVQTEVIKEENLTTSDFYEVDENGNEFLLEYISKINLPAGTIITKDMVTEVGNELTSDQRIQEYNMIVLPSQLVNGNYIDIRFSLPSGADFIVLAKKKVLQCTKDTIWLKLSEEEILTLNNVIVEAYQAVGSKLYANVYVEAGLQESAIPTYPPNQAVMNLIERDPNIIGEARNALYYRYNSQGQADSRINQIDSAVIINTGAIQSGIQEEINNLKSAREEFVSQLEGTKEVGITE